MKIKPEDLAALRTALEPFTSKPETWTAYQNRGLSAERYRWDALHASGFNTRPLYQYLNDSHISTALRSIFKIA